MQIHNKTHFFEKLNKRGWASLSSLNGLYPNTNFLITRLLNFLDNLNVHSNMDGLIQ
jgi:hypothetical protein